MAEKNFETGFEQTEYTPKSKKNMTLGEKYRVIKQIVSDANRVHPNSGIMVSMTGDLLEVKFMSAEVMAPTRIREIEVNAKKMTDEAVRLIKKEYKRLARYDLSMKEKKDLSNQTLQKTSLNERYYFTFWRCFEID